MKSRKTALLATAAGIALLASGCTASAAGADGTLRFGVSADPGSLNPLLNATAAGKQLAAFTYETLVTFPAEGDPQPGIAAEWEETTTSLDVTLREDITCADGSQLTATDVKNSIEYAADEENGSPYFGVYVPADGVEIVADDAARTVGITATTPQSFLLANLGRVPIVCAAGLSDPAQLDAATFGTGPYELTASTPGQLFTLSLRDDYSASPTDELPATVEFEVVSSESTRANMLQAGDLNLIDVLGSDRDRLDGQGYFELEIAQKPGSIYFNQAQGRATSALAVREALAAGLDSAEVGQIFGGGRGVAMQSPLLAALSPVCADLDTTGSLPAFDVEAAKATLEADGWVAGSDGVRSKDGQRLSLKFLYPDADGAATATTVELIQQQWAQIGAEVVPSPSSAYTDVIFQGGDWDVLWAGIVVTKPSDVAGILSGEFPPNGGNWTYNTNQEFADLSAKAQTLAGDASCDAWSAALNSAVGNLDVLPVYAATETYYGNGFEFAADSEGIVVATTIRPAA